MIKCIVPKYADALRKELKSGQINPGEIIEMTPEARIAFFEKYMGKENANFLVKQLNDKLEKRAYQSVLQSWVKSNIKNDKATLNKLLKKINSSEAKDASTPSKIVEEAFSIDVTDEQLKVISNLTDKMRETFSSRFEKPRSDYFRYKQQLSKYIREQTPEYIPTTKLEKAGWVTSNVASLQRALNVFADFSASFRQGIALFGRKQWNNAFARMFEYANNEQAVDDLEIDIISHKYADILLKYRKELGLTLLADNFVSREEAFASKWIQNIPVIKGSQRAYEGFLNDLRFNRFVDLLDAYKKAGRDIRNKPNELKALAKIISDSTGRGTTSNIHTGALINTLSTALFSPRLMLSRVKVLLNPIRTDISMDARIEAIKSIATIAGITTTLVGMAALAGLDVEDDPTSSDFGKIKVGKSRFDVTGGLAPYVTLISRIVLGRTKSTITDISREINTGKPTDKNVVDLTFDFISNKTSPFASVIRDYMRGSTFDGDKIALNLPLEEQARYIAGSFVPFLYKDTVEAYLQASGQDSPNIGLSALGASVFGIGVNTYEYSENWDNKDSKEMLQFKNKVGKVKFSEANNKYLKEVNTWIDNNVLKKEYSSLPNEEKIRVIRNAKDDIKQSIFREYGFRYKQEKLKQLPRELKYRKNT